MSTSIVTHLRPGVLRGRLSELFPEATAVDALGNPITPIDYVDAVGRAWRAFEFLANGALNVTRAGEFQYLIVAGGAAGGNSSGSSSTPAGGGGAGGLLAGGMGLALGAFPVLVGSGGLASVTAGQGGDGANSSAFELVANGGGGGGGTSPFSSGRAGGSGGGGAGTGASPQPGGVGIEGQGNNGGRGASLAAAGGGGAGTAGLDATSSVNSDAGTGLISSITGLPVLYAAGGQPGNRSAGFIGADAFPNTGSGGQGSGWGAGAVGGNGGSGIVIVRFQRTPPPVLVFPSGTVVNDQGQAILDQFGNFILAGS